MFSNSFPDRDTMAELLARMLWEIKAVHSGPTEPYKLASGMASPVYIDCRKLLSYPRIRSAVMDFAAATLLRDAGFRAVRRASPAARRPASRSQPFWPTGSGCR